LDASAPSDVVTVCSGVYTGNLTVPDDVALESVDGNEHTFILGENTLTTGAAVVTVGSGSTVTGFDISCPSCTNGTIAGIANGGLASDITVALNTIHTLRDTSLPIAVGGFEMSGVRLFGVENVVVTGNWIHSIDNRLDPSTFTSRARGIFVSGGDAGVYRTKSEGTFTITDNLIDNISGFRPIGINVHRMDQDVGVGNLEISGNCVSTLFDTGFILGGVAYELDEIIELIDGMDADFNHAERVNIAFAIRNSVYINASRNCVTQLNPIGNTVNLVLDAPDVPGTGWGNLFCVNTLDAAGAILVGPEVFNNRFPFGRTFKFPFGLPDSPGLGGDGAIEAANMECRRTIWLCPTDVIRHELFCPRPHSCPPNEPSEGLQAGPNLSEMFRRGPE
jgi:hypothetical protein